MESLLLGLIESATSHEELPRGDIVEFISV
jgi:hypothetical protein